MKLLSNRIKKVIVAFLLSVTTIFAMAGDKVVYQINDADLQATRALRNIRNQLDVAPDTTINVVAFGNGLDFLLDGARDNKTNTEYSPLISDLKSRGVTFEVCEVTMKRRNFKKSQFVLEASFTKSGVVRITELQYQQHYAYINP